MSYISRALRRKIFAAARNRCGYYLTAQWISGAQLHIEHIIPLARGGSSNEMNLWLACAWCNSFKGVQTHAIDPLTNGQAPIFNPRMQNWSDHFRWNEDGSQILGLTSTGRATVVALHLNNEFIMPARRQWVTAGWHPPVS